MLEKDSLFKQYRHKMVREGVLEAISFGLMIGSGAIFCIGIGLLAAEFYADLGAACHWRWSFPDRRNFAVCFEIPPDRADGCTPD